MFGLFKSPAPVAIPAPSMATLIRARADEVRHSRESKIKISAVMAKIEDAANEGKYCIRVQPREIPEFIRDNLRENGFSLHRGYDVYTIAW